jgi:putative sigma-54 modulation protein
MDAVVDKLERQVVKHKEKIQDHHHEKHFEWFLASGHL